MNLSVIIVDDDIMLGKIQKALVRSVWPFGEPIVCYDGFSALEIIDREAASDRKILVLLDINMPAMDGWGVLNLLCSKPYYENVWIIVNTSSEEIEDEIRSKSYAQVIAFSRKPLTRETLRKLMKQTPLAVFC